MKRKCIVCDNEIENCEFIDGPTDPPCKATSFTSSGHYGSIFDPMDGTVIEICVCNKCLIEKKYCIAAYRATNHTTYELIENPL